MAALQALRLRVRGRTVVNVPCPSCNVVVEQASPPVRGPANDGSEMWLCLKCPAAVCVWCYHGHTAKEHPEAYEPRKKPTVGGKKNRKQ
jgi:hypothetical protein